MSVDDFNRGLSVEEYERSLPVQRKVKLPTKAEEQEDFGIRDDGGCLVEKRKNYKSIVTSQYWRKKKNKKKEKEKKRKKSRKKRKRKTRRKLRKRKKKTKRRKRR